MVRGCLKEGLMKIAVAGATGRVGQHVVDLLKNSGNDVVAISRSTGVDVIIGKGLERALTGVETIIDATSGPSPDQKVATEFFTTASRNLQETGARVGVQRIVVVSIIGIDRFTAGYMAAKIAHEKAMLSGSIPVRILRAAQFHEFVAQIVEWGRKGDVSYVPQMRTQLVAARSVARALADLAIDSAPSPAGTAPLEIAGPRAENLVDMAVRLVAKRSERLRIEGVSNQDDPDRALYESDGLLPGPKAILTGPTFEEWLTSTAANPQPTFAGGSSMLKRAS
jgi:uncharacterized protein YbjT (DUF2867 family)